VPSQDEKDLRWAKFAGVLSEAARLGRINPQDARTALAHTLRTRNNGTKLRIRPRSRGAQASIDKYAPAHPPRNGSPEALHADHIHSLPHTGPGLDELFERVRGVDAWLEELRRLDRVVCVTNDENEQVRRVEQCQKVTGSAKYALAGIEFVDPVSWES
jgi:hypothetical protein